MENNENAVVEPVVEETPFVFEEPVIETPVFEAPVVIEEPVVEIPVFEEPVVVEQHIEPIQPEHVEEAKPEEVQALGNVNGAIGVTTAPVERRSSLKKSVEKKETVAVRSTKNVTWAEVGKVYRGINIVDKDAAEKWLTRSHITLATPEEVAKEFGK